jgi:DNA gyrase subunit B
LKDDQEYHQFLLNMALDEAVLMPTAGAAISGPALEGLARSWLATEAIIERLAHLVNPEVLQAIVRQNLAVDLSSEENARASAELITANIPPGTRMVPKFDDIQERWILRVERMHHGNLKVGLIDEDLLLSGDFIQLKRTAETLADLFGNGGVMARGEKKQVAANFGEAMKWLLNEVERGIAKQRYKGLGEMNPDQLWETTMDPKVRRLLRVQIDDAIAADEIFTTLMGELVEPRRAFIETNALNARIDI